MSTATTAHQRSFPTSLMLGAASAVVVVGGLTAYGISASQDSTAPTHSKESTSTAHNQQCPDVRCLPSSQVHGYGTLFGSHEPALKGGHTTIGLP
jgi:hypothetical protein